MPLVVLRRTVADLPFDFTLDDSLAMSPQMKLSGAIRVVVSARVSRSGNAMPQGGDLRGESAAMGTSIQGLGLSVDSVRPYQVDDVNLGSRPVAEAPLPEERTSAAPFPRSRSEQARYSAKLQILSGTHYNMT